MGTHKLALVPADGVGPEVIDEARKVLEALAAMDGSLGFQYTIYPWGSAYYRETGRMMPEDGLDQLAAHDAILMGAVGDPDIPDHVTLSGILLPIRRGFDQGVCLRPSYLYEGVSSPLAGVGPGDIDLVVFRENTASLQLTQRPRNLAPPRSRESPAAYPLAIPRIATPA